MMYIFINVVSQVEYYRAVDLFFVVLYERTFYFSSRVKTKEFNWRLIEISIKYYELFLVDGEPTSAGTISFSCK